MIIAHLYIGQDYGCLGDLYCLLAVSSDFVVDNDRFLGTLTNRAFSGSLPEILSRTLDVLKTYDPIYHVVIDASYGDGLDAAKFLGELHGYKCFGLRAFDF